MIVFLAPAMLFLLALLPVFALWKGRAGRAGAVRFSTVGVARQVASPRRSRAGRWLHTLRLLVLALGIVALARPALSHTSTEVEASGIDILLGVDVSTSMDALDFKVAGQPVDRLTVVKRVVAKFIEDRPGDRIGLVAFAGRPYLVSPLTLDHDWLLERLDGLETGMIEDGTAIGSAIASGVNRLRDQDAVSRIAILLTDGMNNAGSVAPLTAAEAAEALGIKVYTIGAGTQGEAPIPVKDAFGRERMAMAKVDIDEETLTQVAERTGGQYYRATDTDSLERIYEEIGRLETTTHTLKRFSHQEELVLWALLPALALLVLEQLLAATWLRRVP